MVTSYDNNSVFRLFRYFEITAPYTGYNIIVVNTRIPHRRRYIPRPYAPVHAILICMMRCRWPMLLASLSVVVAVVVAATAVAITNTDAVDAKVVVGTTSTAATTTTTEVVATRDMSLSVTCSDPHKAHRNDTATANEPATTDGPPSSTKKTTEELRKRVEQLTNDLSKASALLEISKQREKQLIVLEKEKYK